MTSVKRLYPTSGFSIIEVLVALAIIGLLAGILFPILFSVKESARAARCHSNLKQLHAAFELYAQDWDGVLPCPGGLKGDLSYWDQEGGGGIDTYLKNREMGGQSVFCCPGYTGDYRSEWSPRTYGMNSFLRTPWDHTFPGCTGIRCGIRKINILEPERTILVYEGMPEDRGNVHGEGYVYRCGDWSLVRGYDANKKHFQKPGRPWHGDRNNYLFCDGHVECLVPEKYPEFKGPTTPDTDLWHVDKQAYHEKYWK